MVIKNSNKSYVVFNIFFIIFFIFGLTNLFIVFIKRIVNIDILERKNKFYKKYLKRNQSTSDEGISIQHDLKEHLLAIRTYLEQNLFQEANTYINKMMENIETNKEQFLVSGNMIIDSILNVKLKEAMDKGIQININIKIPKQLNIDSFDITVILGNILDNAINAAYDNQISKVIQMGMIYNRKRLFIDLRNTYNAIIRVQSKGLSTIKKDNILCGTGLRNVRHIVKRYNGMIDIDYDENWFRTRIMIYI